MSGRNLNKSRIKAVLIFSLLCFSAAILAVSYHHHDASFLLRSCAICNVKSSLSGLSKVNKSDTAAAPAVPVFSYLLIFLAPICSMHGSDSAPASKQIAAFHPNRAPPVR